MTTQDSRKQAPGPLVVGVVADPVAAPAQVAQQLEQELPGLLSEQLDDREWRVEVHRERLPPSDMRHFEMMNLATERKRQHGWDFAVCITDLPLIIDRPPVVADASNSRNVAVVSLPAFGAMGITAQSPGGGDTAHRRPARRGNPGRGHCRTPPPACGRTW